MTATVRGYAPGRTELAGNHTDHQGGRVIAASIDRGISIEAQPNGSDAINVTSPGFALVSIRLGDSGPRAEERGTTTALVRGVADCLAQAGFPVCGFDARVSSTIPSGGGLSSSAAFELALLCTMRKLSGGDALEEFTPFERAELAVKVEREYFGKPCGFMDQMAVALGGVSGIDFSCQDEPEVETIDFDFERHGFAICLIDTHCDHSRYTDEYAQVARDMEAVASYMGHSMLSQVEREAFLSALPDVRRDLGDLPALRGLHYYREMELVDRRIEAMRAGDIDAFMAATRQSGASSAQYLQNVSTFDRREQPAMMALGLADLLLSGRGACRIHGGGFGGTVQAFVPTDEVEWFSKAIDRQLGAGSCQRYRIARQGAYAR